MAVAKNPDDPGFVQQYALADGNDDDIDAPAAWNEQTSCAKVAVLDTGIADPTIPTSSRTCGRTRNEAENGRDDDDNGYVDDSTASTSSTERGPGEDHNGHGTHVAGIIGARGNNDRGVSGLCWKTKIVSVRVMDADGRGYVSDQIAGIQYALGVGAKIINCSFGNTDGSSVLRDAIAERATTGRADRGLRRQRRRQCRQEAGLPGRLPRQQRAVGRRHRRPRQARLVLELRREHGGPGRPRRPCRLHLPGIGLHLHVGHQHGRAVRRGGRRDAARGPRVLGRRRDQLASSEQGRRAVGAARQDRLRPAARTSTARSADGYAAACSAQSRYRRQ